MGLFDTVAAKVLGAATGQQQSAGALGAIQALIEQSGGITGLVKAFEAKGLGGLVQSWVGTGSNQTVSPVQIQAVLGHEKIQALAEKTGLSTEVLATQIAQHLPKMIDLLSPKGQLPASNGLGGALTSILGQLTK